MRPTKTFFWRLSFLGIFLVIPIVVQAATLSLSPAKAGVKVGDRLSVKVLVSGNTPMNGVGATVTIPPSIFAIDSVSKAGSVLGVWATEPTFSKQTGQVKFEGVSLSGFQNTATVLVINLRAIKPGVANAYFQAGQVLANDGNGTNITSGFTGASFTVNASPAPVEAPVVAPVPAVTVATTTPNLSIPVVATDLPTKLPEIRVGLQGDRLAIFGNSEYAKAEVQLSFIAVDGSKVFVTGSTNNQGDFVIVVPRSLKNGPYAVNAVLVPVGGAKSVASNILVIEVGHSLYLNLTWEMTAYLASAITTVLLLLILCIILLRRKQTIIA
jgi:hypothetical protein